MPLAGQVSHRQQQHPAPQFPHQPQDAAAGVEHAHRAQHHRGQERQKGASAAVEGPSGKEHRAPTQERGVEQEDIGVLAGATAQRGPQPENPALREVEGGLAASWQEEDDVGCDAERGQQAERRADGEPHGPTPIATQRQPAPHQQRRHDEPHPPLVTRHPFGGHGGGGQAQHRGQQQEEGAPPLPRPQPLDQRDDHCGTLALACTPQGVLTATARPVPSTLNPQRRT